MIEQLPCEVLEHICRHVDFRGLASLRCASTILYRQVGSIADLLRNGIARADHDEDRTHASLTGILRLAWGHGGGGARRHQVDEQSLAHLLSTVPLRWIMRDIQCLAACMPHFARPSCQAFARRCLGLLGQLGNADVAPLMLHTIHMPWNVDLMHLCRIHGLLWTTCQMNYGAVLEKRGEAGVQVCELVSLACQDLVYCAEDLDGVIFCHRLGLTFRNALHGIRWRHEQPSSAFRIEAPREADPVAGFFQRRDHGTIAYLVQHRLIPSITEPFYTTVSLQRHPLVLAIQQGDWELCRAILQQPGGEPIQALDDSVQISLTWQALPLAVAANIGDLDTIAKLLPYYRKPQSICAALVVALGAGKRTGVIDLLLGHLPPDHRFNPPLFGSPWLHNPDLHERILPRTLREHSKLALYGCSLFMAPEVLRKHLKKRKIKVVIRIALCCLLNGNLTNFAAAVDFIGTTTAPIKNPPWLPDVGRLVEAARVMGQAKLALPLIARYGTPDGDTNTNTNIDTDLEPMFLRMRSASCFEVTLQHILVHPTSWIRQRKRIAEVAVRLDRASLVQALLFLGIRPEFDLQSGSQSRFWSMCSQQAHCDRIPFHFNTTSLREAFVNMHLPIE